MKTIRKTTILMSKMKLIRPNYPELILYLLNVIFVLLISYPLVFVTFFSLGTEEDHKYIMETEPWSFVFGRLLVDVFFIALTMVPGYLINIALKIMLEINKKGILIKVIFIDYLVLTAYSWGLIIAGYCPPIIDLSRF